MWKQPFSTGNVTPHTHTHTVNALLSKHTVQVATFKTDTASSLKFNLRNNRTRLFLFRFKSSYLKDWRKKNKTLGLYIQRKSHKAHEELCSQQTRPACLSGRTAHLWGTRWPLAHTQAGNSLTALSVHTKNLPEAPPLPYHRQSSLVVVGGEGLSQVTRCHQEHSFRDRSCIWSHRESCKCCFKWAIHYPGPSI